mmetsp:Transcript_15743/g.42749  ORF Transcript_15743/g.42749 Transcript_15743/m.42749 type:complete len:229 (-) Transcript_15743:1004-1690(-)
MTPKYGSSWLLLPGRPGEEGRGWLSSTGASLLASLLPLLGACPSTALPRGLAGPACATADAFGRSTSWWPSLAVLLPEAYLSRQGGCLCCCCCCCTNSRCFCTISIWRGSDGMAGGGALLAGSGCCPLLAPAMPKLVLLLSMLASMCFRRHCRSCCAISWKVGRLLGSLCQQRRMSPYTSCGQPSGCGSTSPATTASMTSWSFLEAYGSEPLVKISHNVTPYDHTSLF